MSYLPPPPSKSREIRARYRQRRQKQTMACLALVSLVIVVAVGVVFAVLGLRSCKLSLPARVLAHGYRRPADDPRFARRLASHIFDPAPWVLALDDQALYTGSLLSGKEAPSANYSPLDTLSGYRFGEEAPAWQWQLSGGFNVFGMAGGMICGVREYLAEPARVEVRFYNPADGQERWQVSVDGARYPQVGGDPKVLVLAYFLDSSWRLVAYNPERQAKASGLKLPLVKLAGASADPAAGAALRLQTWPGRAGYTCLNVIGMVDTASGKLLYEHALAGVIEAATFDDETGLAYAVIKTQGPLPWLLVEIQVGEKPRALVNFASSEAEGETILLSTDQERLALAQNSGAQAAGAPTARVRCFAQGVKEPIMGRDFTEGVVEDVALLPTGGMLVALNQRHSAEGLPEGWGRLYLGSAVNGEFAQVKQFKAPVQFLARFKEDCLVLLRGGEVQSFIGEGPQVFRLDRLSHPLLYPILSPSGNHLAVVSHTEAYQRDEPGSAMQVVVYE